MDTASTATVPERRVLLMPEHRKGEGSGHMRRCLALAQGLEGRVQLLIPTRTTTDHYDRTDLRRILGPEALPDDLCVDRPEGRYDLTIIDRRHMAPDELGDKEQLGFLVGLDAPPDLRPHLHYLIDCLSTPPGAEAANITDAGFLTLPARIRSAWPSELRKILVVFGGEQTVETASRAVRVAWQIFSVDGGAARELTVVADSVDRQSLPDPVIVRRPTPDLAEHLGDYDLVLTHFGMLAYEAVWARVPVLLINPTRYHGKLAKRAGFARVTPARSLRWWIRHPEALQSASQTVRPREQRRLADSLNHLELPSPPRSPLGTSVSLDTPLARFADRSYFRHGETGLVYAVRARETGIHYRESYFMEEYRQQYGRTYLEDFDHIHRLGLSRLSFMDSRSRPGKGALLDVGCAYGPFMSAARDQGWLVSGVDVADEALTYVKNSLGLDAWRCDISRPLPAGLSELRFDAVTMWYVIEHFPDLEPVLNNVSRLLRPGGLFAFSSPHGRGISARRNLNEFLAASPADHYTIFDRQTARRTLARFGLRLVAFRTTGHHPERFRLPWGIGRKGGRGARFLHWVSRHAGLGDTFEALAVREAP